MFLSGLTNRYSERGCKKIEIHNKWFGFAC